MESFKDPEEQNEKNARFFNKQEINGFVFEERTIDAIKSSLYELHTLVPGAVDEKWMDCNDQASIIEFAHELLTDEKKMQAIEDLIQSNFTKERDAFREMRSKGGFKGRVIYPCYEKRDKAEKALRDLINTVQNIEVKE